MKLKDLKIGEVGIIKEVHGDNELRQHLLDMGMIPGVSFKIVKFAPMGDPIEILIQGYELTIRLDDAANVDVEYYNIQQQLPIVDIEKPSLSHHPGLGENGIYHNKEDENPLPKGTTLTFALIGNQNCGKTTLFNQLTGSNQHVGNFPGVTVDRIDGVIKNRPDTLVTDLPGVYSLSPYTPEEVVSREFILNEKPKGLINIIDGNNIERNLYLTLQLMELDIPVVLAVNMMDEIRHNGGIIDVNKMEELLGIPVVPISASKNEGVTELVKHAMHIAKYQEKPLRNDFCSPTESGGAVHRCIHGIMSLIEDHAIDANIPVRFAATKIIEGDHLVIDALHLEQNELEMIEHIIIQMEEERGLDRKAAIADMRYSFILSLCKKTVKKPKESIEHKRSTKLDKVLTGKFTAIPCFILIMAFIFFVTFFIGGLIQDLLDQGIKAFTDLVGRGLSNIIDENGALYSLIIKGIFGGVGSVLSFLPIIVILFLFLSLLEDSGYMARVAFVMDKLLRKIGLSGRSIVPMLIGFGCTVPAVMSTRTLPSERDRKMTVFLTPFMSCSAKIPVYAFFAQMISKKYSWLIMISLYLLGIMIGIFVALLAKRTVFKGEAVPFVMELPNYRIPGVKNVLKLLWEKAKDFLKKAFTIIFLASIVIWFLQSFDFSFHYQSIVGTDQSILAKISSFISPIFTLQGFNDWRITTGLVTGFIAKESVVSTLELLLAGTSLTSIMSPVSIASLLVFCLLYTPCIAAIASIRRELGHKWAIVVVLFQCSVAWLCSLIAFGIGSLVMLI